MILTNMCACLCNQHHNWDIECFHEPKRFTCAHAKFLPSSFPNNHWFLFYHRRCVRSGNGNFMQMESYEWTILCLACFAQHRFLRILFVMCTTSINSRTLKKKKLSVISVKMSTIMHTLYINNVCILKHIFMFLT